MNIQKTKKLSVFFLLATIAVALSTSPAMAKKNKKKKSKVSAYVVYPTCLRSSDGAIIGQTDVDGIPDPVTVEPTSPDHWVHCPVNLPASSTQGKGKTNTFYVLGVEVCHSETGGTDDAAALIATPEAFSHISQTLVTKLESPGGSEPKGLDETPYSSLEGACFRSPMAVPFPLEGPISIDLKLHFAGEGDQFNFGRIRVLLSTQSNSEISSPSEPSEPSVSVPSTPSEISIPSLEPSVDD